MMMKSRKWSLTTKPSTFDPIVLYIIGKLCIFRFWNSGGKSFFDHLWSARIFVTHPDWIATLIWFLVLSRGKWGWVWHPGSKDCTLFAKKSQIKENKWRELNEGKQEGRPEAGKLRTSRTHSQIFFSPPAAAYFDRFDLIESELRWWPTWQEVSGGFQVLGLEDEAGWVAWAACPPSSQPSPTTRSTSAAISPSTAPSFSLVLTHPQIWTGITYS